MTLRLRSVAHSEIGLVRKNNQDSGFFDDRFLVVADGMGGAAAGDLASSVAVDEFAKVGASQSQTDQNQTSPDQDDQDADAEPTEPPSVTGEQMLEVLAGIIARANDTIADLIVADPSLEGMGTTVSAGMFDGELLALAHIGDSRAYLYRDGQLRRLTHDHSWVQSLVDEGRISEAEAHYHPHRSLLLKVLNGQPVNEPDLSAVVLQAGDRLLFCSDGLCGLVDDPVLAERLAIPDLDNALTRLTADAHDEGGIDNITIILSEVRDAADHGDVAVVEPQVLGAAAEDQTSASHPRTPVGAGDRGVGSETTTGGATRAPEGESSRYALRQLPSRRRRAAKGLGLGVLVLVLLSGLLFAGYAWSRTQYFVGATDADQVAIFQGLSENLGSVPLSKVYEVQQIDISDLPPFYQEQVRDNIEATDLTGARATTEELRLAADQCITARERRARATTSPTPVPTPDASASPSPPSTETTC